VARFHTQYALSLLQAFDLQFLVVVHVNNLHTIEQSVQVCWWVRTNRQLNDTKLTNLSIKEYKAYQEYYASKEESHDQAEPDSQQGDPVV